MPYCPKCKSEYRDGYGKCSDCGEKLVDWVEPEKLEEEYVDNGPEVFLMHADDDAQANIIESMLRAHDIPVLRKYKGSDGYMSIFSGRTLLGIGLYVPQNVFDTALEIVGDVQLETEEINNEDDALQNIKAQKAKNILRFIAISMIAFLLIVLVVQIFTS